MTNLTDALYDLKSELAAGTDVETAINTVARDYGLKPTFLGNRANAVLGDLQTWAERDRVARGALAPSLEAAKQKMAQAQSRPLEVRRHRAQKAGDEFDQAMRAVIKLLKTEGVDVADLESLLKKVGEQK